MRIDRWSVSDGGDRLTCDRPGSWSSGSVLRGREESQRWPRRGAVDYDVHPELASKALAELCRDICAEYPVRLVIFHSRGFVRVGEASVVIAASSAHRKDALGAVSDAIDQLKVRVPIWKKEIGLDHEQRWLDGHSLTG